MDWQSYILASHLKLIRYKQLINEIIHTLSCPLKTVSGFGAFQGLCTEPAGTVYIDQRLMLKDVDQPEFTL